MDLYRLVLFYLVNLMIMFISCIYLLGLNYFLIFIY